MDQQLEELQRENKELKEELSFYKVNGAIGLYYELNRFVNTTVDIMRTNTLKSLISGASKEDDPKKFEKIMALIKNSKEHIADMKEIKSALGLTDDEEKDKQRKPFIERIAEKRD